MESTTHEVITTCATASNEGRMHFSDVVTQLSKVGVESYHVDYRSGDATYYLPSGETLTIDMGKPKQSIAASFDEGGVRAAIRAAQSGQVMYPEFKRLTQAAGCASYTVWITGRHVSYFGRQGEVLVEQFPN